MKNILLNLRTVKAQAEGYAKVNRMAKFLTITSLILTLCVGQMWATSEGSNWYDALSANVYFDNTNSSYSNVSILIGRQWNYGDDGVGSEGINFTLVSGTNNLYYASVSFRKYTTFCFIDATNWGWEGNNVTTRCGYASHYTDTPNDNLSNSTHLYVPASGSNNASVTHTTPASYSALNYTQTLDQKLSTDGGSTYSTSTASLATLSVSSNELDGNSSTTTSNGTISAGYSSTTCSAARTATVTYTVSSVTSGYTFVGWYDGDTQKSTSDTYSYNATEAKTITARFKEEAMHDVTISYLCSTATIRNNDTESDVGVETAHDITAPDIDGYTFSSWTVGDGIKNNSGSTTANPININTKASGSYTLTANYTANACTLYKVSAAVDGDLSSVGAMTFDPSTKAYYRDVTTNSSPYYFRFYYNSDIYYSTDWSSKAGGDAYSSGKTVSANGSKVDCDQNVSSWGTKPSIVFSGLNSSAIRIWFDYQNHKTWITETTYSVAVSSESTDKGTVNTASVTAGKNTASSSIEATPKAGYKFKQWSVTSPATLVSGATTNPNTVKTTNTGGAVQAQFEHRYILRGSTVSDDAVTGGMAGWSATDNSSYASATIDGNVMTITANLTLVGTQYKFKFHDLVDGSDKGQTGTGDIPNNTAWTLNGSNDVKLTTTVIGTYTFAYNVSTNSLTVTYPTIYTITFGMGTGGSTISASATSAGGSFSSGTSVRSGDDVTFTQTALSGYTFAGWYTAASGGSAVTGMGVGDNVLENVTADKTVYSRYTENKTAVTITTDGHGTITTPDPNESPYNLGVVTTQAINASPNTGYSWNTWTASGNAVLVTTATEASNTAKGNGTDGGSGTITATFIPNPYDVILDVNGGSGDNQTVTATFDAAMPTTLKGGSDPIEARTKTGYNFAGYTANADGTGTQYYTSALANNHNWDVATNETSIYAKWTPKQSAITFDYQTGTAGYSSSGSISNAEGLKGTYDAAMTALTGTMPSAAQGYAFMGFYDAVSGGGTKYYNADGTSAHVWNKDTESGTTLYAYYKQAQITAITFDGGSAVIAPRTSATVTATIDPIPTGDYIVCWRILHSNDNPLDPQPTFTPGSGASVSFTTSETSGIYKVEAKLQTGTTCGGIVLSTETANFQVAGSHTVSILYKDASGNTLQPYSTTTGYPLEWTRITAPDIFGYDFTRWDAGDGITLSENGSTPLGSTTSGEQTIYFQAIYDGSLTAVYTQRNLIYFKNTLGWGEVYVNFYDGSYWSSSEGSGNNGLTHGNIEMTQIEGTDIWYYDYQSASITPSLYVSFTSSSQANAEHFWGSGDGVNVVYPANYADDINTDKSSENGFKAATPMFIPLAGQTAVVKNSKDSGKANYYNNGYWTTYTPGTGYTLEMYNDEDDTDPIKVLSFTSANDLMPMQIITDLEANKTYRFQVRRGGTETAGIYYGNVNTMTYANHGAGIGWEMSNTMAPFKMAKITTTATGEYTFNLSYSANESNAYRLRMRVDYPIADGDYQLVYTDAVQTKAIKSAIVNKVAGGKDTVSFFIRKASSPVLRIQKASVNASTGAITWAEYPNPASATNQLTSAILSGLPKDSVYNICLTMAAADGAISVENVEGYSGYYYIRTDAANSKWDNYRASDHMMTYSEYSEKNSTFTHYFTQFVDHSTVTNVKFVIANDYAPNISDTLIQQASDVSPNHVDAGGYIQAAANVRFMWDIRDNTVSRAYLAAAKEDGTKFLVLRGQASELLASDGSALVGESKEYPGNNHGAGANCIQFVDDDNWIYETTVQIVPSSFVKLYAKFHGEDIYYRGLDNNTFDEDNAIQLIAGSGDEVQVRIIYDFKTDRIISALIPSGEITEERAIHADVMFIREGQGDIGQLWFSGDGELSEINTAYGVMRLNKYTLNNKDKSTHDPLASPASIYERSLYFISFPFKVKLNEAFGIGTYGKDWIIQRYRGDLRAERGFWAEDDGFWEYIWDRRNVVLEPNVGYLLQIELGNFGESTSDFWANGVENVELFFPSSGAMPNITKASVTHTLPAHECTINRMGEVHNGVPLGSAYDRRIVDSHWNVMSVPTYINTASATFSDDWITTGDGKLGPKFFYEWNKDDNTLTARTATGYTFHAMYAYMVQYKGRVTWSANSGSPYTIVARKTYEEAPQEVEFRIELQQNDKMVDQTFISLSNDEEVTSGFEFGYDLSKEKSSRKANIYTLIGYVPAAGNSLPLSEQTTVVPVGVQIPADGDYTFAIPDGTSGIGVTLIDTETGIRTSLSALDYTIRLNAGTYESRFLIEISPVQNTPTGIEEVQSDGVQGTKAHKMLIDNLLYIVKDGKMYDARGARVE